MHQVLDQMLFVENVHVMLRLPLMSIVVMLVMRLRNLNLLVVKCKHIQINVVGVFHSVTCGDHPNSFFGQIHIHCNTRLKVVVVVIPCVNQNRRLVVFYT